MAYEQKNNSGSLFNNDRRTKDTHPNLKGKALIDGQWYWVSAWTKTKGKDEKFLNLSYEAMTPEQVAQYAGGGQGGQTSNRQPAAAGFRSEEVPW